MLEFKLSTVYGRKLYLPMNDKARILSTLVGLKWLREQDILNAQKMGLKVKTSY